MARKLCVGYNEYYKMISMKNIIFDIDGTGATVI